MKQLENFWMPFSPNADFKENPRIITKAEGVYLWNEDGRKICIGAKRHPKIF